MADEGKPHEDLTPQDKKDIKTSLDNIEKNTEDLKDASKDFFERKNDETKLLDEQLRQAVDEKRKQEATELSLTENNKKEDKREEKQDKYNVEYLKTIREILKQNKKQNTLRSEANKYFKALESIKKSNEKIEKGQHENASLFTKFNASLKERAAKTDVGLIKIASKISSGLGVAGKLGKGIFGGGFKDKIGSMLRGGQIKSLKKDVSADKTTLQAKVEEIERLRKRKQAGDSGKARLLEKEARELKKRLEEKSGELGEKTSSEMMYQMGKYDPRYRKKSFLNDQGIEKSDLDLIKQRESRNIKSSLMDDITGEGASYRDVVTLKGKKDKQKKLSTNDIIAMLMGGGGIKSSMGGGKPAPLSQGVGSVLGSGKGVGADIFKTKLTMYKAKTPSNLGQFIGGIFYRLTLMQGSLDSLVKEEKKTRKASSENTDGGGGFFSNLLGSALGIGGTTGLIAGAKGLLNKLRGKKPTKLPARDARGRFTKTSKASKAAKSAKAAKAAKAARAAKAAKAARTAKTLKTATRAGKALKTVKTGASVARLGAGRAAGVLGPVGMAVGALYTGFEIGEYLNKKMGQKSATATIKERLQSRKQNQSIQKSLKASRLRLKEAVQRKYPGASEKEYDSILKTGKIPDSIRKRIRDVNTKTTATTALSGIKDTGASIHLHADTITAFGDVMREAFILAAQDRTVREVKKYDTATGMSESLGGVKG